MKPLLTVHDVPARDLAGVYYLVAMGSNGEPLQLETCQGTSSILSAGKGGTKKGGLLDRLLGLRDKLSKVYDMQKRGVGIEGFFAVGDWWREDEGRPPETEERVLRYAFALAHAQFPPLDALERGGRRAYGLTKTPIKTGLHRSLATALRTVYQYSDGRARERVNCVFAGLDKMRKMYEEYEAPHLPEVTDLALVLKPGSGPGRVVKAAVPVISWTPNQPGGVWAWRASDDGWVRYGSREAQAIVESVRF